MVKQYRILYTQPALEDLEEKARYLAQIRQAPRTAEQWYLRLRAEMEEDLTTFPYKYALCTAGKWRDKGVRQAVFRSDVVLYSVEEEQHTVYIRAVCTKGQDLPAHLDAHK